MADNQAPLADPHLVSWMASDLGVRGSPVLGAEKRRVHAPQAPVGSGSGIPFRQATSSRYQEALSVDCQCVTIAPPRLRSLWCRMKVDAMSHFVVSRVNKGVRCSG